MPNRGKKAQASVTRETIDVSQRPQREQCSLAGNLSGHPDASIGMGDDDDDADDSAAAWRASDDLMCDVKADETPRRRYGGVSRGNGLSRIVPAVHAAP